MTTSDSTRFLEIEHKFVVSPDFDPSDLFAKIRSFKPEREYETLVSDTYYLLKAVPDYVYRHRYDGLIQHLTTKSVSSGKGDSEVRTEINLELDLSQGDLGDTITAFLAPFGIEWSGFLKKTVQVFYFSDIEIVFYRAAYQGEVVSCIELEARSAISIESARELLQSWELRLGLAPKDRCHLSLLHLLVLDTLPTNLKTKLMAM